MSFSTVGLMALHVQDHHCPETESSQTALWNDPDCIQNSSTSRTSHVQVSITPPRSLSEDVRSSKQWCSMVKFCLWAMCPRIEQLCSATAQAGQRNPFSNWCTLVKPSALSYIPLRLKLSSVCKQVSLPIGFTLPQKVWLTLFYRILSFVLVEWSLIYITNCKTKVTKYNKNIFLQSSMIIIHIIVLSKGLSTALSVKAMPNSADLI